MKKVAVIGAGIAGLACAYELKKKGFDVEVFEKQGDVAGRMGTSHKNTLKFDKGAQFFCHEYHETKKLCQELGVFNLWHETPHFYHHLFHKGELKSINLPSIWDFFSFPTLSFSSKLRFFLFFAYLQFFAKDLDFFALENMDDKYLKANADRFSRRFLGKELTETVIDSFISAFQFHGVEDFALGAFFAVSKFCGPKFSYRFVGGAMDTLPQALRKELTVHCQAPVHNLVSLGDQVKISTHQDKAYDAAVIATPPQSALFFYQNPTQEQLAYLGACKFAKSASISFEVPAEAVKGLSLVFVPKKENELITSYFVQSCKDPSYTQDGKTLLTVFLRDAYCHRLIKQNINEIYEQIYPLLLQLCPPLRPVADQVVPYELATFEEAMPKFSAEQIKNTRQFWKAGQGQQRVYLCGDYVGNPWVEGALKTGLRVADKIHKDLL